MCAFSRSRKLRTRAFVHARVHTHTHTHTHTHSLTHSHTHSYTHLAVTVALHSQMAERDVHRCHASRTQRTLVQLGPRTSSARRSSTWASGAPPAANGCRRSCWRWCGGTLHSRPSVLTHTHTHTHTHFLDKASDTMMLRASLHTCVGFYALACAFARPDTRGSGCTLRYSHTP
jgi:hypothetical protein